MEGCGFGTNGDGYGSSASHIGKPRSYFSGSTGNSISISENNPSLRHGWANDTGGNSALLFSYFDVTGGTGGHSVLNSDLTVTSINPLDTTQKNDESAAGRTYNSQKFLVGGSRIATLDNVNDATLENKGIINLVGPLVVGFEVQTDTHSNGHGTRKIINSGTITDEAETGTLLDNYLAKGAVLNNLYLATGLGAPNKIKVTRTNEGYTGYKVGLILTMENSDPRANSRYILENSKIIKFNGEKSIGIQIFSPGSISNVEVSNNGTGTNGIFIGGKESYGMKWSSRVSGSSTMNNTGTINISGDNGDENSLSSGIAVIENESTAAASIRAWNNKVTNNGTINVSGGKANTGMVLIVNAKDDITNTSTGTINVHSEAKKQNIAMRVDKGKVLTDNPGNPKAINNGKIYLSGDSSMGLVSNDADVTNATGAEIKTTSGKTIINGIGIVNKGGNLENKGEIELILNPIKLTEYNVV